MDIKEYQDQIASNKRKFQTYNVSRLQEFKNSLSSNSIIELIDSLPLLIINNQPELPGYIENYKPICIYGYASTSKSANFLKRKFPKATIATAFGDARPLIELFAIMGSAGSIAYNEESDIDYWICIDERKTNQKFIEQLRQKLRGIEIWITENYNIEMHFYLNDISKVKNDLFDTSEDGFSGKANGKLLKDEFYRSSILLNGKIPFWWVVPSGTSDNEYIRYRGALENPDFEREYVDFGNLSNIDRDDFLGGGLFQILKSLNNPFKSIIKIGIVEKYLFDDNSESILLCNLIKKNVQEEKLDVDHIDPYVLMFNQVNSYYSKTGGPDQAMASEIIKMCFYIKIDPNLSMIEEGTSASKSEKILKMQEYTNSWQWTNMKLKQMDNFKDWDIAPINKFWNSITKHILKSYKRIMKNIQSDEFKKRFSHEDIKFITRKINSAFSYSNNKIKPAINFKDNPIEKNLRLESVSEKDGKITWFLSKGFMAGRSDSEKLIIHKEPSLIAMLAWLSMNRMFKKDHTRVEMKSRYHLLDSNFVRALMNELTLHFSIKRLNIHNDYLLHDPLPLLNFIIINLYSKYPKDIEDIFYLYHNSWGETIYEKYEAEIDLSKIIERLLNGALLNRESYESCVYTISPYPYGTSKSFKAIQFLIKDIYDFFISPNDEKDQQIEKRYITILGNTYNLFSYRKIKNRFRVTCGVYDSEIKMLYALSNINGRKTKIRIDSQKTRLNHLRAIGENFKDDTVQIYYQQDRKHYNFYLSDEQGSLIFFRKQSKEFIDYLYRLYLFSRNAVLKISKNYPDSPLSENEKNVMIYEIKSDTRNNCRISKIDNDIRAVMNEHSKSVVPFRISINLMKNREIGYSFSLPFGSMSEVFPKSEINKIIRDLSVYLDITNGYNYFVTDIDTSKLNLDIYKNYTSLLFSEKNKFELLIERSLRSNNVPAAR